MLIARTEDDNGILRRFLSTQPTLMESGWEYIGAGHERPDFVHVQDRIGIELAEWLDESQTAKSREVERFETEINEAAIELNLRKFAKSFKQSTEARYITLLNLKRLPKRNEKRVAISRLFDFLSSTPETDTEWERKHGVIYFDLPMELARFFQSIRVWRTPVETLNLGFSINKASSFDPEDAVKALVRELDDKLVRMKRLYREAKSMNQLSALWLVVHYGRGLLWNTPYDGIGLKHGRPLDERTSRQIIVERCHGFISRIGSGVFDRVFLFFDMFPGLESFEIWPHRG